MTYEWADFAHFFVTNSDEAELLLNGKVIGKRKDYDPESGMIYWDVPYAQGRLQVVAYSKKEKVAEDIIVTADIPTKIDAQWNKTGPFANGDVALIQLSIQDQKGNMAHLADHIISCEIDGPAKLLGLENASHNVAEDYNADKLRCKNGKMLAYIQATANVGEITITFEAPYLSAAVVNISLGIDTSGHSGSKF